LIHIGRHIKEVFDRQPKGRTVEWFADNLCCNRANIYNIFKRSSIDTQLLRRISLLLDYDFFADLSQDLTVDKK